MQHFENEILYNLRVENDNESMFLWSPLCNKIYGVIKPVNVIA